MVREDEKERESRRRREPRKDDSGGFSFTLPPIRLPKTVLPSNLRIRLPPPALERDLDVGFRTLLLVAVLVDLFDVALLFAGPSLLGWVRVVLGTAVALFLVGPAGLVYLWEGVAVVAGFGWLTAFPSATALVLARALR